MAWKESYSWWIYGLLFAALILLPDCNSGRNDENSSVVTLPSPRLVGLPRPPLTFEVNAGQTDRRFQFVARGMGYNVFLNGGGARLDMQGRHGQARSLQVSLQGANQAAEPQGLEQLPGIVNYFRGGDPKGWHTGIHTYSRVQFRDVYPGVNLVYYGNDGQLENDFVLAPNVNPNVIRMAFQGSLGVSLDPNGDLLVANDGGSMRWEKPVVYQPGDAAGAQVQGRYVLSHGQVGFEVGPYDPKRPLVIDPILTYATYYGGQGDEAGRQVAVDSSGNVYMAGWSTSFFPTTPGSYQAQLAGPASSDVVATGDAVVMKLNPAGTAVIYATYIGGTNDDGAYSIAVDSAGNAYITGATLSTDFPTTAGALQTKYGGASSNNAKTFGDAFIVKLNPSGSQLLYSTYLGGTESDEGWGIAIDSAGNAYVAGTTASKNFPTTNGVVQASFRGGDTSYPMPVGDAFVAKLNPTGSALVYSTFLGGSGDERGQGIAIDSNGNAYIVGCTNSQNFPTTTGAFQTRYGGNGGEPIALGVILGDAFLTKLNSTGTALIYSTYLGGLSDDFAMAVAVDSLGSAYVTGFTLSVNFPTTTGAFQTTYGRTGGSQPVYTGDAFVTKFSADGTKLVYSTYLGGSLDDSGNAIVVDSAGNAYVAGGTLASTNFPVSSDATQPKLGGSGGQNYTALGDAFVTKLNPTGTGILFSTYLGGENDDVALGMAVDSAGNIFLSGNTASTKFPVTAGAAQTRFGGARGGQLWPQGDIFLARIGAPLPLPIGVTVAPATATLTASQTQQFVATLTNTTNVAVTWSIQPAGVGSISTSGLYAAPASITSSQTATITATSAADATKSATATVTLNPTPPLISAANVVNYASLVAGPVTPGMVVKITGSSFGPANSVQGTPDPNSGVLANNLGGTQVLFDGNAAPIVSVSSGTVVAIVPYEVAGHPSTVMQVIYQGVASATVTVPVTDVSPGLFSADSSGAGQGLIYNSDSSPNSDANPAPIESNITIIGTGEGQTSPPGVDGQAPGGTPPMPVQPVAVTIGGVPATVVSAGGDPGLPAGYFQVTVTIPDGVMPGDLPVVVTVGSASSQGGITVAVSPPPSQ